MKKNRSFGIKTKASIHRKEKSVEKNFILYHTARADQRY
jgi:hypothetical protein